VRGNPILKTDNLEARKSGGLRLSEIHKTFQDAVEMVGKSVEPEVYVAAAQRHQRFG
jgi:hypothetical protein